MALRNDTTFAAAPKTGDGEILGVTVTDKIGFYGATAVAKPTVTGSKGANAALTSLIAALVAQGLIIDTTS